MVAVEINRIFIVILQMIQIEHILLLGHIAVIGDGRDDRAVIRGIIPYLHGIGLGHPEAGGRVGRAVETGIRGHGIILFGVRRIAKHTAELPIRGIRAVSCPVMVGLVIDLIAVGVFLFERLAHIDKLCGRQLRFHILKMLVVTILLMNIRQDIIADVACRGCDQHGGVNGAFLRKPIDIADVTTQIIHFFGIVDKVTILTQIDTGRAVVADGIVIVGG